MGFKVMMSRWTPIIISRRAQKTRSCGWDVSRGRLEVSSKESLGTTVHVGAVIPQAQGRPNPFPEDPNSFDPPDRHHLTHPGGSRE